MFEKFRRQPQEMPVQANVGHITTFMLGCEACPNKREICARYLGRTVLDPGTMPLRIAIDIDLKMTIGEREMQTTERISEVAINEASCSGALVCGYKNPIEQYYDAIAGDPSLLNAQLGIFPEQENKPE